MQWTFGIILLVITFLLSRLYTKTKKAFFNILAIILILFLAYSYFTYDGAVRLGIALKSKDISNAYTTKITQVPVSNNNIKKYSIEKTISDDFSNNVECRNYLIIIKTCDFY